MYHEEQWIDGKLCWRSSPDGEWTAYTLYELGHRYQAGLKRYDQAQATIADLQGQVNKWQDIASLRFAGDHKFVKEMELLKIENTALQQRVAQLEGDVLKRQIDGVTYLYSERGKRMDELREEYNALQADHARLLGLVQALPCFDGEIKVKTYHHESDRGQEWDEYECGDAGFDNLEAANAYAALLRYRASLPAQPAQGGA